MSGGEAMRAEFEAWWNGARYPVAPSPFSNGKRCLAWNAWQAAVAAEREACAKMCDERAEAEKVAYKSGWLKRSLVATEIATSIRARGAK